MVTGSTYQATAGILWQKNDQRAMNQPRTWNNLGYVTNPSGTTASDLLSGNHYIGPDPLSIGNNGTTHYMHSILGTDGSGGANDYNDMAGRSAKYPYFGAGVSYGGNDAPVFNETAYYGHYWMGDCAVMRPHAGGANFGGSAIADDFGLYKGAWIPETLEGGGGATTNSGGNPAIPNGPVATAVLHDGIATFTSPALAQMDYYEVGDRLQTAGWLPSVFNRTVTGAGPTPKGTVDPLNTAPYWTITNDNYNAATPPVHPWNQVTAKADVATATPLTPVPATATTGGVFSQGVPRSVGTDTGPTVGAASMFQGAALGQRIQVTNATPSTWNGNYRITAYSALSPNQFTAAAIPPTVMPGSAMTSGQVTRITDNFMSVAITAASSTASTMVFTEAVDLIPRIGEKITTTGFLPPGYNGTWMVHNILAGGTDRIVVSSARNPSAATQMGTVTINSTDYAFKRVSAAASNASNFTITTAGDSNGNNAAHQLAVGDSVTLTQMTPTAYNGTWTVATVPSTTQFTVTSGINPGAGMDFGYATVPGAKISAATSSTTVKTFTTSVVHGLVVNDAVTVSGMTPAAYNGTYKVATVPSTTQFTVLDTVAAAPAAASGFGRALGALSTGTTGNAQRGSDCSRVVYVRSSDDGSTWDGGGVGSQSSAVAITALTATASVLSVTTSGVHGLITGDTVTIRGASTNSAPPNTGADAVWKVASTPTTSTLTINCVSSCAAFGSTPMTTYGTIQKSSSCVAGPTCGSEEAFNIAGGSTNGGIKSVLSEMHTTGGSVQAYGQYVYVLFFSTNGGIVDYWSNICPNDPRVAYLRVNNQYGDWDHWGAPIQVTPLDGQAGFPSLSVDQANGDVYFLSIESSAAVGGRVSGDVMLYKSTNQGGSFTTTNLGNVFGSTSTYYYPPQEGIKSLGGETCINSVRGSLGTTNESNMGQGNMYSAVARVAAYNGKVGAAWLQDADQDRLVAKVYNGTSWSAVQTLAAGGAGGLCPGFNCTIGGPIDCPYDYGSQRRVVNGPNGGVPATYKSTTYQTGATKGQQACGDQSLTKNFSVVAGDAGSSNTRVGFAWMNDSGQGQGGGVSVIPRGLYYRNWNSSSGWGNSIIVACMQGKVNGPNGIGQVSALNSKPILGVTNAATVYGITAASQVASTQVVTFTTGTRSPETLAAGDWIHIWGMVPKAYNGNAYPVLAVPDTTHFTVQWQKAYYGGEATNGIGPGTSGSVAKDWDSNFTFNVTGHGYSAGDVVHIEGITVAGAAQNEYNNDWVVGPTVSANQFAVTNAYHQFGGVAQLASSPTVTKLPAPDPCIGKAAANATSGYQDFTSPSLAFYGTAGVGVVWEACKGTDGTAAQIPQPVTPCDRGEFDPGSEILYKESGNSGANWGIDWEGVQGNFTRVAIPAITGGNAIALPSDQYLWLASSTPTLEFDKPGASTTGCAAQSSGQIGAPELGCVRYVLFRASTGGLNANAASSYPAFMKTGTQI
jgi:hypothetical protein